jgi:hypothetical protein
VSAEAETPADRLERWIARDAEIGLAATRDELRLQLAERDREIADLRARLDHLADVAGQLRTQPAAAPTSAGSTARRVYLGVRRRVGRLLRS